MAHGTASGRLRKMIMFELLHETGNLLCFQCGEKIEKIEELSIEHKIPWLDSENPKELFFDLDNIAFSHLSCNTGAARRPLKGTGKHPSYNTYKGGCRCSECKEFVKLRWREYRERKK